MDIEGRFEHDDPQLAAGGLDWIRVMMTPAILPFLIRLDILVGVGASRSRFGDGKAVVHGTKLFEQRRQAHRLRVLGSRRKSCRLDFRV